MWAARWHLGQHSQRPQGEEWLKTSRSIEPTFLDISAVGAQTYLRMVETGEIAGLRKQP